MKVFLSFLLLFSNVLPAIHAQNSDKEVLAAFEDNGTCMLFVDKVSQAEHEMGSSPCKKWCPKNKNQPGIGCSAPGITNPNDPAFPKLNDDAGNRFIPGKCVCEDPQKLLPLVEPVLSALSELDNIICAVSISAFKGLAEIAIDAIPEGAEFDAAINGAKTFAQNALGANDFFDKWVGKVCKVKDWNFDINLAFGNLVKGPKSRGPGKGCVQKEKKACDKKPDDKPTATQGKPTATNDPTANPKTKTDDGGKTTATQSKASTTDDGDKTTTTRSKATTTNSSDKTTTDGADKTTTHSKATTTKSSDKTTTDGAGKTTTHSKATTTDNSGKTTATDSGNEATTTGDNCKAKRAGGGCDVHTHFSEITASTSKLVTITKTCQANDSPQACFNYYSVIQNYPWVTRALTCTNSNGGRKALRATDHWQSQHTNSGWRSFTASTYTTRGSNVVGEPQCERDEFPPNYFLPGRYRQDLAKKSGQLIRWIPKRDNNDGGSLWTGFCKAHDGGEGNGQYKVYRGTQSIVNTNLVDLQTPGSTITRSTVNGQTTTTTTVTQFAATYPRAVMRLDFNWGNHPVPSRQNDWGLRENPCWPRDIVPDNPGYVLLNYDRWYDNNDMNPQVADAVKAQRAAYSKPPDPATLQAAQQRRANRNNNGNNGNNGNTGNTNQHRRGLDADQLLPGDLAARDDLNTTSHLPDDPNVEIIDCQDALCTEERKELAGEENVVFVPGHYSTSTTVAPSQNLNSVPTHGASTLISVVKPETRDPIVPEVAAPTVTA